MKISTTLIKELRKITKASIADCQDALREAKGDIEKAKKYLTKKGAEILDNKKERSTKNGLIAAYIHSDKKIGVLLELVCETDFVAKTEEFQNLAKELTMQIAATDPKDINDLMKQAYIRDESMTIKDLLQDVVSKIRENVKINRFCRYQI